jgi:hypothetical protein
LVGGITGAVVAIVISLIAYRIYRHNLITTLVQQQGWENAQETRQKEWELQQRKRMNALEERLTIEVQQVQHEWDVWEQKDIARVQTLEQQYEFATAQTTLEYTLENLPFVEDASLPATENSLSNDTTDKTRATQLAGEDLSGRDLSRRYLSHANLRGTLLTNANLFMADLSYACLVGADLTNADLSGANLVGADLSNALLTNTNMLVADIKEANFSGADISKARNLIIPQQVEANTTSNKSVPEFDKDEDLTQTRLPIIPKSALPAPAVTSKSPVEEATASEHTSELSTTEETITRNYDIVRAQSLDAIPEPEAATESEQQSPILSFPGILPQTPLIFLENAEPEEESPSLSDETLRVLEEIHFSTGKSDSRSPENFDTTSSQRTYDERRVRAS